MTQMLASVTHAAEARLALGGGVDIIDCKDPGRGALGALPTDVVADIVREVGGRRPVSATVGDLPSRLEVLAPAIRDMAETGVDYVKVGLFRTRRIQPLLAGLGLLARRHRLIAVLFADRKPSLGVVPQLAAAGFAGVMLDTADKGSGPLLACARRQTLERFVAAARDAGLSCGFAGSLGSEHVGELMPLGADYLGFRGALCEGARISRVCPASVARVRACIPFAPEQRPVSAATAVCP